MGRLSENSVVDIKNKSFAVTVRSGGARRRRRGRDHRPGRPVRRMEPVRQRWPGQVPLQRAGHQSFDVEATEPIPAGTVRCAWSSPTTAAAWARAETSPSLRRQGGRYGSGRSNSGFRLLRRRDHRYRLRIRHHGQPRLHRSHQQVQRQINWIRIDLGDDAKDADHYIEPDERFRIAMARQ